MGGCRRHQERDDAASTGEQEYLHHERARNKIGTLPGNLSEAITALEKDEVVRDALGSHVATHFIEAKRQEWQEYIAQVHGWELQRYLGTY